MSRLSIIPGMTLALLLCASCGPSFPDSLPPNSLILRNRVLAKVDRVDRSGGTQEYTLTASEIQQLNKILAPLSWKRSDPPITTVSISNGVRELTWTSEYGDEAVDVGPFALYRRRGVGPRLTYYVSEDREAAGAVFEYVKDFPEKARTQSQGR